MQDVWIIDSCRTPRGIGKPGKGALTSMHPQHLLSTVLKALAEYHDITLGDLLEGVVLHAFDGKCAFTKDSLRVIGDLKKVYGLDLDASASHKLKER